MGVGIGRGRIQLSPGLLQGQRILAMLERSTLHVSTIGDFDRFPSGRHFASALGLTPRERDVAVLAAQAVLYELLWDTVW